MLAPPHRKRLRSSSPPPEQQDHSSPLDTLLKRRRKIDQYGHIPLAQPALPGDSVYEGDNESGPSTLPFTRFIERRRTRQWERQNAPLSSVSSQSQSHSQSTASSSTQFTQSSNHGTLSHSQPNPSDYHRNDDHHNNGFSSPIHPRQYSTSQPDRRSEMQMSSSPVRHQPPSSSPFRDRGRESHTGWGVTGGSQSGSMGGGREGEGSQLRSSTNTKVEGEYGITYVDEDGGEVEDRGSGVGVEREIYENGGMMDEEEMKREWGDEYTAQNTLLHNLHLARSRNRAPLHTPDSPHGVINPNTNTYFPPQETPYRSTAWPSSSPFETGPFRGALGDADESMDMDMDEGLGIGVGVEGKDEEVENRYEEANRLLRELAVVRRQRWGG